MAPHGTIGLSFLPSDRSFPEGVERAGGWTLHGWWQAALIMLLALAVRTAGGSEPVEEHSTSGGTRIVADDWFCDTEDPVTDLEWWGPLLGWSESEPPDLPVCSDAMRATPACPGDADGDRTVDPLDVGFVLSRFRACPGEEV